MAKVIDTESLKEKIDKKQDFLLVDVLSENSFEGHHIPTAVNIPGNATFVEDLVKKTGAKKDDDIIVYCSSETCGASPAAAKQLEEAGFTNVSHFKGGLAGWQDAGYEFERVTKD